MINIPNILFSLFFTLCVTNSNADTCMNHDTCLCQLNENDKIDISELTKDIIPPYYLNETFNNFTYTFLGCKNRKFDQSGHPYSGSLIVSVLTNITNNVYNTIVFDATEIKFIKEGNDYRITYVSDQNKNIHPVISLLCSNYKNPFLKVITFNETDPILLLSSPKLCIQTEHHNNGMSGGSTFLLILFIAALIYFVAGALLLYFIRGARGVEMIPNVEFWTSLPGLVKDGLIFLLSGCKPSFVTTAETYDRI